ncbi:ATP-binding protein [Leifsonia sp. NPDC056824]|uniref:ATP-binding protein n=1 Tax=Leifsonia sp. NPDC056824 TaxID=3345953 RepID=UPI00369EA577
MTDAFREAFLAPADAEAIERVHTLFEELAVRRPDIPAERRGAFELAVVEVVTNVIQHGKEGTRTRVELEVGHTPDGIRAVVTDDAEPADIDLTSTAMPDPEDFGESGRGLALIALLVDEFTHEPLPHGNRWTLASGTPKGT